MQPRRPMVRRGRRLRLARLVSLPLALGLSFLATACGLPTSATPQGLSGMPASLNQPVTKFHRPVERVERHSFDVYFVATGRLIGVPRNGRATEQLALRYLESGPNGVERNGGITTAVPNDEGASVIKIVKQTAVVNLTLGFGTLSPLGVAQIVWTLTVPPVKAVIFLEADQPVDAPTGTGRYIARAVTRADYENYAPA